MTVGARLGALWSLCVLVEWGDPALPAETVVEACQIADPHGPALGELGQIDLEGVQLSGPICAADRVSWVWGSVGR
ncbi:hypothetical protein [Streptomyces sp. NPDC102462]|uniref:hypothetical protein n=1 Tax=Streptomyces sp. NPDC102462 TaxID=3366178 RepID=UPI0037F38C25